MARTLTGPLPEDWCREHFDHLSEPLAATMPETMARMRALAPVAHSDAYDGFWVVSSYQHVREAAQDWGTFSSAHGLSITNSPTVVRNLPVEIDPPQQRLFKKLINPFFTPATLAARAEPTRALVRSLLDQFAGDGECEFMDAFARPFPSRAFFELAIDAPTGDLDRVIHLASRASTPTAPDARECWQGLYEWIKNFLEQRREQSPSGDVVDGILHATIDGEPITPDEMIGTLQLLVLGGLETTAGALGLMFLRFCREPDIPALLRENPSLIPRAVEELLRLDPPFVSVGRTAVRDAEFAGNHVREGDKVLLHWASANRDADEFPDPDRFDLDREHNPHFAFGVGPHRCAGSNLARLNLRIALEELLPRMHDIRLADGADVRFHAGLTRSPLSLPITFRPAA